MKRLKNLMLLSLVPASLLLAGTAAKADSLSISLDPTLQVGSAGDVLAFDATVTNNSGSTVFLNGDNTFVDAPLTLDESPFDAFPLTLGAGDSFTGVLFNIDIPAGAPSDLYTGSFDITGGHFNSSEQFTVGVSDFEVQVAPAATPEPSSILLLATGLAGLALVFRRNLAL